MGGCLGLSEAPVAAAMTWHDAIPGEVVLELGPTSIVMLTDAPGVLERLIAMR
jgi:hypothetical protein